jgi:undecaprenyl-diphosphatase
MMHLCIALIILGVFQGVAEFLPISSSGHLVILGEIPYVRNALDATGEDMNMLINVSLHVATLIAILIYLRSDIYRIFTGFFSQFSAKNYSGNEFKTGLYVLTASVPAGVLGLMLHEYFEILFNAPFLVFIFLIINGIILITANKIDSKGRKIEEAGFMRSLIIGFCQAFAMIPGISRAGMTISGGIISGLEPVEAARFSFLMAIPVIAGAGLLEGINAAGKSYTPESLAAIAIGMAVSVIVALAAIRVLFWVVKKVRLDVFGYYTIAVGISGLAVTYLF